MLFGNDLAAAVACMCTALKCFRFGIKTGTLRYMEQRVCGISFPWYIPNIQSSDLQCWLFVMGFGPLLQFARYQLDP